MLYLNVYAVWVGALYNGPVKPWYTPVSPSLHSQYTGALRGEAVSGTCHVFLLWHVQSYHRDITGGDCLRALKHEPSTGQPVAMPPTQRAYRGISR